MSDGDETHMTFASCVKDNPHARTHIYTFTFCRSFIVMQLCYQTLALAT